MIKIAHLGSFDGNLGDNVALYNIQKRINELYEGKIIWNKINLKEFSEKDNNEDYSCGRFEEISEENDLLIIGGGGMIQDTVSSMGHNVTNETIPNHFNLPITEKTLKSIKIPIICFALGVNTFRIFPKAMKHVLEGDGKISEIYPLSWTFATEAAKSLRLLYEQSVLFSVRDDGSYDKFKKILGHLRDNNSNVEVDFGKLEEICDPGVIFDFEKDKKDELNNGLLQPACNGNPNIVNGRTLFAPFMFGDVLKLYIEKNNLSIFPHTKKDYDLCIPWIEQKMIKDMVKEVHDKRSTVIREQLKDDSICDRNRYIFSNEQFEELVVFENVLEAFKNYLNYDYGCVMRGHGQLVTIGLNIPCIYFSTQDKLYDYSYKNGFMDYTVDIHPHEDLDPNVLNQEQIVNKFNELQAKTFDLRTNKEYLAKWYDIRDNVVKSSKLKFDKFCLKVIDYIS